MPRSSGGTLYKTEARLKELRRLGLSRPVIRLAMFDLPNPSFIFRCDDVGPPFEGWRRAQPAGPPVTRLWCCGGMVTGARFAGRWPPRRVEFLRFKPHFPADGHVVVAYSEQGLLADLFSAMFGDVDCLVGGSSSGRGAEGDSRVADRSRADALGDLTRALRRAADAVGFRYFDGVRLFREAYAHRADYGELVSEYTRSIGRNAPARTPCPGSVLLWDREFDGSP